MVLSRLALAIAGLYFAGGSAVAVHVDLGTVPFADLNQAVRLEPWSTLPGNIQQMTFLGDKLFFATNEGQVWEYDAFGNRISTAFLDVNAQRASVFMGLRGIAFHPDFDNSQSPGYRKFYTHHNEVFGQPNPTRTLSDLPTGSTSVGNKIDTALFEWTFGSNLSAGVQSSRQVYRVQFPYDGHFGQNIAFNPTANPGDPDYGKIYLTFGDSAGSLPNSEDFSGDPVTTTAPQAGSTVLGKIVRIDPLQDNGSPFSIPNDNPFVGDGGVLDEIWAIGFRNPQTMSFDTATGKLLVGNISQQNIEEIELIEPGKNYGWSLYEGTYKYASPFDGNTLTEVPLAERQSDPFTYPVVQFDHLNNQSNGLAAIVAGYVYHGTFAAELEGRYLFGNLSTDQIFLAAAADLINDEVPAVIQQLPLIDRNGDPTTLGEIVGIGAGGRANMRFGQDTKGEIYVISKTNDTIYRFESPLVIPSILGDVNIDGVVDEDDVTDFVGGWLFKFPVAGVESWMHGDLNLDGIIDLPDAFLLHNALAAQGLAFDFGLLSPSVPEPKSVTLIVAGASVLVLVGYRQTKSAD